MINYYHSYCPKCMKKSDYYYCIICGTKTVEAMKKMPHCKNCGCTVAEEGMAMGNKFDFCGCCGSSTTDAVIGKPSKSARRSLFSRIFRLQ